MIGRPGFRIGRGQAQSTSNQGETTMASRRKPKAKTVSGAVGHASRPPFTLSARQLRETVRGIAEGRTRTPVHAGGDDGGNAFHEFVTVLVDEFRETNGEGPRWDDLTTRVLGMFAAGHAASQRAIHAERNAPTPPRAADAW